MTFAVDLAFLVDLESASGDDFAVEWDVAGGNADAVELQLQISLAPEVAGIFGGLEMPNEITSARECLLAEHGNAAKMT